MIPVLEIAKAGLATARKELLAALGDAGKPVGEEIDRVMKDLKPKQDGKRVVLSASIDSGAFAKAVVSLQEAGATAVTANNFRHIALGMAAFSRTTGAFPAHAIYSRDRKPLLSWRVTILPHIGENDLYSSIRRNEPWDSEHNKQFWGKMPKVYEMPDLPAEKGMTAVQVFTGPNTMFNATMFGQPPEGIKDGQSQTILIVEARDAVNWMEPKDIALTEQDWGNLRSRLGSRNSKGTLAALCDTQIRFVKPTVSNATLRAAITPAGVDILGPDW
jgi:hypothetical protein